MSTSPTRSRPPRDWLERNRSLAAGLRQRAGPGAIAELVPEGEGGHVLITSRAHADWRSLGARPIALDVWEREESLAFLERAHRRARARVCSTRSPMRWAICRWRSSRPPRTPTPKRSPLAGYLQRLRDRAQSCSPPGGRPATSTRSRRSGAWRSTSSPSSRSPTSWRGCARTWRPSASRASCWTPTSMWR